MANATYSKPTLTERWLNGLVGLLLKLGIGPGYLYTLEVRGRKSGKLFQTPVDLMDIDERSYLVAPRGNTQWVRNARAAGEITLRRGSRSATCRFSEIPDADKAPLLKEYLTRYTAAVQQFFPVAPDAPLAEFEAVASHYPVFLLEGDLTLI